MKVKINQKSEKEMKEIHTKEVQKKEQNIMNTLIKHALC